MILQKKILIYMPNWLGDVVMALPAIKILKELNPNFKITILTQEKYKDIYINEEFLEIIIIKNKFSIKTIKEIRKNKFDIGFLFVNSFSSALLFFLSNIKERLGYKKEARNLFLTKTFIINKNLHQSDIFITLISGFIPLINEVKKNFSLTIKESQLQKAEDFLKKQICDKDKKIIGLGIGAMYGNAKEWAIENYTLLAKKIIKELGYAVMLIGSLKEKENAEKLINALNEKNIINAVGNTNIIEAISLISKCKTFIGNDSGLVHVSASLGIFTISLFGSTSPEKTAPKSNINCVKIIKADIPCSPCFKRICPKKTKKCMNSIFVKDVFEILISRE